MIFDDLIFEPNLNGLGWTLMTLGEMKRFYINLTPLWQSSGRNFPVKIVQKLNIFYSGILNLEFPIFFIF